MPTGKKQQRFEIAEFGLLLLALLVWLWEWRLGGGYLITTLLLWGAVGLSFFNRLAQQKQQRRQTLGMLRGLEQRIQAQFKDALEPLEAKIRQATEHRSHPKQVETEEELQTYLHSFETALTQVVQYLNQAALDERLTNLEQAFLAQHQEPATQRSAPGLAVGADLEAIADPWETIFPTTASPEPPPKQQWQLLRTLAAHKDCVSALAFSHDQRFLASGGWDHQLKLWQVEDGKQISQVTAHDQGILNLKFIPLEDSAQGLAIASSGFSSEIKLWQLDPQRSIPQLELQQTLEGHLGAVYALAVTVNKRLISGSHDQTLRQWQLQDGRLTQETLDLNDQIQAIALAPQENLFISGGTEGVLKFWRTPDHHLLGSLKNDPAETIQAIAIRADGKLFASGGDQGLIHLWQLDLNTLETLPETVPCFTLKAHDKPITKLLFSGQGNFLFSGSADSTIKVWQLGIPEPLTTLYFSEADHSDHQRLLSLALSADGRTLAAGGSDGSIKLWRQI
ncbi:WD-repeat protein [[Synechococcus] sp. NIES-970]|nr:WD-repeat protein [[Synechococcus] sp. NIES-970]